MGITQAEYDALFPESGRSAGAKKAKQAGKDLEHLILSSCTDEHGTICQLVQIKNFAKRIPDKSKVSLTGKMQMMLVEEKSPFDFAGAVWGSAVGIFIDAKSQNETQASFPANDPKNVKPHQIKALLALESAGSIAGFLVRCGRMRDYRWLWASQAFNRRKAIQWDDPAWDVLGPIRLGYGVPMRKLVEIGLLQRKQTSPAIVIMDEIQKPDHEVFTDRADQ